MPKKSEYFLNLLGLKSFSINNLKIDIPEGQAISKPKILFKNINGTSRFTLSFILRTNA